MKPQTIIIIILLLIIAGIFLGPRIAQTYHDKGVGDVIIQINRLEQIPVLDNSTGNLTVQWIPIGDICNQGDGK